MTKCEEMYVILSIFWKSKNDFETLSQPRMLMIIETWIFCFKNLSGIIRKKTNTSIFEYFLFLISRDKSVWSRSMKKKQRTNYCIRSLVDLFIISSLFFWFHFWLDIFHSNIWRKQWWMKTWKFWIWRFSCF